MKSTDPMSVAEFEALRATIASRGTLRPALFAGTMAAWAVAAILAWSPGSAMLATIVSLVPLLVLAAGFEAVFHLHTGVERVGRYLQLFYERTEAAGDAGPGGPLWETTIMRFGREAPGRGSDPLFSLLFGAAIAVNSAPAVALPPGPGTIVSLAAHAAALSRIILARRSARRQREADLEVFAKVRDRMSHPQT